MADHDSDIPQDADQGAVPNAHRGEPLPAADAHPRSAPDADVVRPDQEEELGPIEGLMHAASTEVTTETSDDPNAEAEASRLGIESEGVEASQIFSLLVATVVTLALAVFGVFWLVAKYSDDERVERDAEATNPEIVDVRNRATDLLENYGRTEDTYRMKIDDAMALVASEYVGQQGADATPAPLSFDTVYLGGYFDDSGFEPPVPDADSAAAPVGAVPPGGARPGEGFGEVEATGETVGAMNEDEPGER